MTPSRAAARLRVCGCPVSVNRTSLTCDNVSSRPCGIFIASFKKNIFIRYPAINYYFYRVKVSELESRSSGLDFRSFESSFRISRLDFRSSESSFRSFILEFRISGLNFRSSMLKIRSSISSFRSFGLDFRSFKPFFRKCRLAIRASISK